MKEWQKYLFNRFYKSTEPKIWESSNYPTLVKEFNMDYVFKNSQGDMYMPYAFAKTRTAFKWPDRNTSEAERKEFDKYNQDIIEKQKIFGDTPKERIQNFWVPFLWEEAKKTTFEDNNATKYPNFKRTTNMGWHRNSWYNKYVNVERNHPEYDKTKFGYKGTGYIQKYVTLTDAAQVAESIKSIYQKIKDTDTIENFELPEIPNRLSPSGVTLSNETPQQRDIREKNEVWDRIEETFKEEHRVRDEEDYNRFMRNRANVGVLHDAFYLNYEVEQERLWKEEQARRAEAERLEAERRQQRQQRADEIALYRSRVLQRRAVAEEGRIVDSSNNHFSDSEVETEINNFNSDTDTAHPAPTRVEKKRKRRSSFEIVRRPTEALRNVFFDSSSEIGSVANAINRENEVIAHPQNQRTRNAPPINQPEDFVEEEEESDSLNLLSENSEESSAGNNNRSRNNRRRTLSREESTASLLETDYNDIESDFPEDNNNDNYDVSNRNLSDSDTESVRMATVPIQQRENSSEGEEQPKPAEPTVNQERPANQQLQRREALQLSQPNHADRNNQGAEAANRDEMARQQVREVNRIVRGFAARNEQVLETLKRRMTARMSPSIRGSFGIPGSFNFYENIFASHNDSEDILNRRQRQRRR